jgi:hypothetical protein
MCRLRASRSRPRRTRALRRSCVALLALLLAGCGGTEREQAPQPQLPARLAAELATRSDEVAARLEANDSCGARTEAEVLLRQTIAAVNERRIPPRYQEELTGSVNALLASITCEASPLPSSSGEDQQGNARELADWLRANSG